MNKKEGKRKVKNGIGPRMKNGRANLTCLLLSYAYCLLKVFPFQKYKKDLISCYGSNKVLDVKPLVPFFTRSMPIVEPIIVMCERSKTYRLLQSIFKLEDQFPSLS